MNCVQNYNKKRKKYTHDIESIRHAMKFDKASFAKALGLPYRTYQDYAAGLRKTPDTVIKKAIELQKNDRITMKNIRLMIADTINKTFPNGIQSQLED